MSKQETQNSKEETSQKVINTNHSGETGSNNNEEKGEKTDSKKRPHEPGDNIKLGAIVALLNKVRQKKTEPPPEDTANKDKEIRSSDQASLKYQEEINKEYMDAVESLSKNIKKYYPKKGREFEPKDNMVQCWKCNCLNLVHPTWEYIECSDCRSLCKIPKTPLSPLKEPTSSKKVPCLFTMITCPKCKTSNKCLAENTKMICIACRNIFDIVHPDLDPPEEECDSLDPHSRYYKFKYKRPPEYPPINSYGVNDLFFPDPVMVNWMPVNPYVNYNAPYQEIKTFERMKKYKDVTNRIKKEYFGKIKLTDPDKVYLLDKLKELNKHADNAIKDGYNNRYDIWQKMGRSQNKQSNYIDKLKNERMDCYEKMFFLK